MTVGQFREWTSKYLLPVLIPALAAVFYFYDPAQTKSLFPKCVFHQVTGLHCPGCGGQRALHQLLHGNIWQTADYNLLFLIFLPFLAYAVAIQIMNGFSPQKTAPSLLYHPAVKVFLLAATLLFWLLRNIKAPLTAWLAP